MIKVEKVKKKKDSAKEETVCLANGLEVSKFENFKKSSQFLKEPLATELVNESDHFTNDAVQLLKFHGSYQQDNRENRRPGKSKDWQMMLRLRNPGGEVPGKLFLALDELSDKLGNGTLRATTRQAFQMHGIRKENLKEVIQTIVNSMGSTLAACGDINRNVMAPAAPFDSPDYNIARALAKKVADLLTPMAGQGTFLELWADGDLEYTIKPDKDIEAIRKLQFKDNVFSGIKDEPLYGSTYLPRKFKCAVTVPGDNSVDLLTNDIGIVAFTSKDGNLEGCNFYVGGGMGRTHNNEETFARIADPLGYAEEPDVYELIQSIVAIQRDYGDRKNRKHARLKYLVAEEGTKWFKRLIEYKLNKNFDNPLKLNNLKVVDHLGWHEQGDGKWYTGIFISSGRIIDNKNKKISIYSSKFACPVSGFSIEEIEPRLFSFNSPYGACEECEGIGVKLNVDPNLVIPNDKKSIIDGAVEPWSKSTSLYYAQTLASIAKHYGFSINEKWYKLTNKIKNQKEILISKIKKFSF